MKSINRILTKVFNTAWLIKPEVHYSFQRELFAILEGKQALQFTTEDNEATVTTTVPTIGIVPVFGVIGKHLSQMEMECGGCSLDNIQAQLKAMNDDPAISKIVLYIHSPGGTVTNTPETGDLIKEVSQNKEVIAYTDSDCCSGALWLASCASRFYAAASACVGSCGVYSIYLDETRALEMAGLKVTAISAGKYKLTGASFKPLNEEETNMLMDEVKAIHAEFKAVIQSKRNVDDSVLEGQTFDGKTAANINLTDGVIPSLDKLIEFIQ